MAILFQVRDNVQAFEQNTIVKTLKDHLHQCPSKLSEEMIRCMAIVYCWLRSATSVSSEKNRSPFLSRSSTNVIQPRRGIIEDQDWSGKSMVEILWISTDKGRFSHASYAINNYRLVFYISYSNRKMIMQVKEGNFNVLHFISLVYESG